MTPAPPPPKVQAVKPKGKGKSLMSLDLEDLDEELETAQPEEEAASEEPSGPDLDPSRVPAFMEALKKRPELEEKRSLNAIAQSRTVEAHGPTLRFVLANDFEWRFVEDNRIWLTELARRVLAHPTLMLTYRVDERLQEEENERIRQQSPEYRLEQMLQANPALRLLIDRFGLQPD